MVWASVIIPAYNAEGFVQQAISSALRQTERRIEVLVIDDASTDATAAIVAGVAAADQRVRLLQNTVNSGPGAARNRGIGEARGAWISLLDADDAFEPDRIERLLALAEQKAADIVSDNVLLCSGGGNASPVPLIPLSRLASPRLMSAPEFIEGNIGKRRTRSSYGFMHPVLRRSFLESHGIRYRETNRFGEDYLLSVDCLMKGARWWITPEPMYRYKVRSGSLTEVVSCADLDRIRKTEETLLREEPKTAADPLLGRALRRHKATIDRWYYYRAFTGALKAKSFGQAACLLFADLYCFRCIVLESLHQAPVVIGKALRGGYFRPKCG